MRILIRYTYGFGSKKSERLEINKESDTDSLLKIISEKI